MASLLPFAGVDDGETMGANRAVPALLREVWAAARKKPARAAAETMASKAVAKRVVAVPETQGEKKRGKPVRDGQHYIKTEVLKQLGDITDGMIKKAKGGGTAPLKLLWELGKLHEDSTGKRKRKPASLSNLLMAELRKRAAEKALEVDATPKVPGKEKQS